MLQKGRRSVEFYPRRDYVPSQRTQSHTTRHQPAANIGGGSKPRGRESENECPNEGTTTAERTKKVKRMCRILKLTRLSERGKVKPRLLHDQSLRRQLQLSLSSFPHLFSSKDEFRCLIPCAIDQVDIPIKYLCFFLEDDSELEHIRTESEVKKRLIEVLTELVERHHRARAAVTDEMVDAFMAVRPLPNMFC